mmetsp:Transcript_110701/g.174491  ORF Transcript_110701/g.174491 Transcript_110701/m.174491 type:complete len:208 (-) Transcript_110701:621-1244(-)
MSASGISLSIAASTSSFVAPAAIARFLKADTGKHRSSARWSTSSTGPRMEETPSSELGQAASKASPTSLIGGGSSGKGWRSRSGGASVWSLRKPIGRGPRRHARSGNPSLSPPAEGIPLEPNPLPRTLGVSGKPDEFSGPRGCWNREKRSSTSTSCSCSRLERPSSSVSRECSSPFCCRTSSNCCRVSSNWRNISRSRWRMLITASV